MNITFLKHNWKKPWFIASAIIGLIIVIVIASKISGGPGYELTQVVRTNLIQEVIISGKVKASEEVNLALEKGGRISRIYKKVGETVYAGQAIVQLENGELAAQLAEAEANIKAEKAQLEELKRGSRPEEVVIQEAKVADARQSLINKIGDAYTKSDDAIRYKVDQFISNSRVNPQLNFTLTDSKLKADIENQRLSLESVLVAWQASLAGSLTATDLASYLETAKSNLNKVRTFMDLASLVVNSIGSSSNLSQTTIDAYRSDVSTGRTNVNTAISNLSTADANLKIESGELALDKAGAAAEELLAQQAALEQVEAKAQNILAQIEKTLIRSPIRGIVTRQDAKIGEIVSANETIVGVISTGNFEIEANVPETDVSKIAPGNPASITLDAYGQNESFEAKILRVDPAETIINGVAAYRVILQFTKEDTRIRSGMTSNVKIVSDKRENVLAVPRRAVVNKGIEKTVKVSRNGTLEEVKVITGISGNDGLIEIVSGLNEGDSVVTYLP